MHCLVQGGGKLSTNATLALRAHRAQHTRPVRRQQRALNQRHLRGSTGRVQYQCQWAIHLQYQHNTNAPG